MKIQISIYNIFFIIIVVATLNIVIEILTIKIRKYLSKNKTFTTAFLFEGKQIYVCNYDFDCEVFGTLTIHGKQYFVNNVTIDYKELTKVVTVKEVIK